MSVVTGLPPTRWAKDEEYNIPFYQEVTKEMIEVHEYTGSRKRDPQGEYPNASLYADGLYWSRQWEYPWAIESAELVKPDGFVIEGIEDMKVLDVGCGHAPFLIYLGQMGCQAYGSDPGGREGIEDKIDGLWGIFNPCFGWPWVKELRQEGMEKVSWPDDYFDRVFCISVIEHLPIEKVRAGVRHMKRVLKPQGLLVVSVDSGLMKDEIVEAAAMPFYGGVDLGPAPSTEYPHVYPILGMVFQKGK